MLGSITQILGAHFGTTQNGELVCSESISTFLPPHVRERFIASYVFDLFSLHPRILVVTIVLLVAADILGLEGQESLCIRHFKISICDLGHTSYFQVSHSLC
jgi:hypothetical protein